MPPKRNHHQKNSKPPTSAAGTGVVADCVFPHDIMLCILTRLPVKSIHRFKAVCKPWCKLFATPDFMKWHHAQFSRDPRNQSVIIYSFNDGASNHTMSLFEIGSIEAIDKPLNLDHPYPKILDGMDFVGCINGLVCMADPFDGQRVDLWNPASKLYKTLPLPGLDFGDPGIVSLGFGFDEEADDFKVVRVGSLEKEKKGEKKTSVGVEVYSAGSNTWRTIKAGFWFSVLTTRNNVTVNGNPYWVGSADENESGKSASVLVWFDVRKMVFKTVPLSSLNRGEGARLRWVNWKGSLAALVYNKERKMVKSLAVWVFDDGGKIWRKNRTFGPIRLKVDRFLECTKSGKILGECPDGKVFVFDPENGSVKEIVIDGAQKRSFKIFEYTECLTFIEGMKKVVVKEEEEDEYDLDIDSYFRKMMMTKIM